MSALADLRAGFAEALKKNAELQAATDRLISENASALRSLEAMLAGRGTTVESAPASATGGAS